MTLVRKPAAEHIKDILAGLLPSLRPSGWALGDPEAFEVWNDAQDVAMNDIESDVLVAVSLESEERDESISQETPAMAEVVEIVLVAVSLESGNTAYNAIMEALRSDQRRQQAPDFDKWERIADEEAFTRTITAFVVI